MTYDPIDNFLALKSIKTFIKNHGNNDNTEHEKLFDLFFFRTFSEIRMQSSQDVNKYIQKLSRQYDQETVMVKLYKKLYADETKLPSNPLNEVYTKAFVELTEEGFFNKNFKPIGVFSPKSYCLKTAYQNIKETYGVPNFMEQHFGKDLGPETDLSQYIKNTISDVFIRDSDETSRENMLSVLRDGETEILETYSIVGASHVGTFSPSKSQEYIHQAQSGQSKFKTLHITQKVDGRPVKQHLFPEKHGYPHSYNSLLKYIKNQNKDKSADDLLQIPTKEEEHKFSLEIACDITSKFTSKELSFLMCTFTPVKSETETSKECQTRISKYPLTKEETVHCAELMDGSLIEDLINAGICTETHSDEL